MKQYRVWVTDIALQSVVVEAKSSTEAKKLVEAMIENSDVDFEQDILEQSLWEVSSIDERTK